LLKPQRYIHFTEFIIGYFAVVPTVAFVADAEKLLLIFVSFNVLLYSGLYIVNDLIDLPRDRQHPVKKNRPIAYGAIQPTVALVIAVLLILFGLLLGGWITPVIIYFELSFLIVNLLYSTILKRIPYLDVLGNAITHPLRVVFAICVFGQLETGHWIIIVGIFIMSVTLCSLKRYKELVEGGGRFRLSLRKYSRKWLFYLMVFCYPIMFSLLFFASSKFVLSVTAGGIFLCLTLFLGYITSVEPVKKIVDHILAS
jgi:4-hydroxybenzoate polyprenyltransferase